jgi:ABC-type transport system involved in multi-copper enzyme maturation permease subunit
MDSSSNLLLSSQDTLQYWVAGVIVVLGLLIYGLRDVLQFSFRRANAIASVSFRESIRRRVLWITPLAMIGVVLVSQLQRPLDEQDAVRQTIKFSLFASGMVVVVTAIILACTNLPKEIENRVIYTIVTKPTTRLEIVVGKIMGFARVSLAILLLMGGFTWSYLHVRAWSLRHFIAQRLESGAVESGSRATLEYWRSAGLLSSRSFERPDELQVFAKFPEGNDTRRWFFGSDEGEFVVPFQISREELLADGEEHLPQIALVLHVGFDRSAYNEVVNQPVESDLPLGIAAPTTKPATAPTTTPSRAAVRVEIYDENFQSLVDPRQVNKGEPLYLTDPTGQEPAVVFMSPEAVPSLLQAKFFYVDVVGLSRGVAFFSDIKHDPNPQNNPVCIVIDTQKPQLIGPMDDQPGDPYRPALPSFRSRGGLYGQQLRGGKPDRAPVALYKFRGQDPRTNPDGTVAFEMKVGIERSGDEADVNTENTRLEFTFVNKTSGQSMPPIMVYPESNRTAYFNVPQDYVKGGNFDVYIRNLSTGHYAGLLTNTLSMVASQEPFDWNLIKSLLIMWMLSILVVVIAIFCSTFLSWPIAFMLTLVLLLGHWTVVQLSGSLAPGIGNRVATDIFGAGSTAAQSRVVSNTVEAMSKVLNSLGSVLPDIGQFSAIDDIERGISISWPTLASPLLVLAVFGLPMIALSYIILRNKEVAP